MSSYYCGPCRTMVPDGGHQCQAHQQITQVTGSTAETRLAEALAAKDAAINTLATANTEHFSFVGDMEKRCEERLTVIRNDRDRLAAEVERLSATAYTDYDAVKAHHQQQLDVARAESARLVAALQAINKTEVPVEYAARLMPIIDTALAQSPDAVELLSAITRMEEALGKALICVKAMLAADAVAPANRAAFDNADCEGLAALDRFRKAWGK